MIVPRIAARAALAMSLVFAAGLLTIAGRAVAQDIRLTGEMVGSFIGSYGEIKAAAEAVANKYDVDTSGETAADRWSAWMSATGAYEELNGVAASHGYASFSEWLQVTVAVARAYAFAGATGAMDAAMAESIAAIKSNPGIPEDQKALMLQQLQAGGTAFAMAKPPQEDIDAVAPYMEQLSGLFDQ